MSLAGDLTSDYKVAYAKGIKELVPKTGKFTQEYEMVPPKERNGKNYEEPISLTQEAGFTYEGDSQEAYALNSSIGMEMQSAIVPGFDITLASTIGTQQAAKANGPNAFKKVMSVKLANMLASHTKRVEINCFYGGDALATTVAQATATTDPLVLQVSTATWASGIWSGLENQLVVFSNAATGAVVDSLLNFRVARVDSDARTVAFAAGTGSLANLETAYEANALNIHFFGSVSNNAGFIAYKEAVGVKKILTNTGTLYNINAANYDLWRGNVFANGGGQLTQGAVNRAVSLACQRGLVDDVTLWLNPDSWTDLLNNQAAQRMFDSSYSSRENKNGSKDLVFYSQNGTIVVKPYALVKEGDAFILPNDGSVKRIGAQDIDFTNPARPSQDIFFDLPANNGVGLRSYSNQATFIDMPASCTYISGIVNS